MPKGRQRIYPLITSRICPMCGTDFAKGLTDPVDQSNLRKGRKFCSVKCMGKSYRGDESLFWSKIDKNHPSGCWVYSGACDRRGYGRPGLQVGEKKRRYYAHRRSYELLVGPIPSGMLVLHRCDNPPCCNPAHLFLGTDADNARDAKAKGRNTFGAKNRSAKLTEDDVRAIRPMQGKISSYELAKQYGVTYGAIAAIWRGDSWAHVK